MKQVQFWLRWSWRDLKARWLQVVAIGIIIALGTGIFSGFGGQKKWRINSLNESYGRLNSYDLRMTLTDGSYLEKEALLNALQDTQGVKGIETRLIIATQVDASQADETILVQGEIVGVDVAANGPHINQLYVNQGRDLIEADTGKNVVMVEYKFAKHYGLKPGDALHISGDIPLDFVGSGQSPEYFYIIPAEGVFLGEASYAVLFMPLETVQGIAGREGLVNSVVMTLDGSVDGKIVQAEIQQRMAQQFPDTGFEMNTRQEDNIYKLAYSDAKNDQVTWNIIAYLFLIGAAMGAFNLAGRMVEAQRRQIGIGMALGVPRFWIAFRPLLVGLQIAVAGMVFGLGFGALLSNIFGGYVKDLAPLPYWIIKLDMATFLKAALVGFLLPFVATLIPTWRAVRVNPIDAIQSGTLVAKGGGLTKLLNYLPIPGQSFARMPFRNILRAPWRTTLTILGVAVAITLMTMFVGFLDTFVATMDRAKEALLDEGGNRVQVNLNFFYPIETPNIQALDTLKTADGDPLLAQVEPRLMLGGTLKQGDTEIETMLELVSMDSPIWKPTFVEGNLKAGQPGIVLSEKAAKDLGVKVGDTITLEHPLREDTFSFRMITSEVKVAAIHNNPMRSLNYMDMSSASMMGLEGQTNLLVVTPSTYANTNDIKRALFSQPGVSSVVGITEYTDAFDEILKIFAVFLRIVQVVVLFMAFLIAFNSTSINVDERVREIATMFAFGLPVRTVTRMQIVENILVGIFGTLLGILAGWLLLQQFLAARVEDQLEDINLIIVLSPTTILISIVLGVLVVALTPILSIRRMLRMDIPSTLRYVE
ncbi:MAG: ABC transporter permease [Chloroflexi bacterium]|nr:ABC transporter permease [Chloroflexota bacterium]